MKQVSESPVVHIRMLGEFSITINGNTVNDRSTQSRKPWLLMEYLVAFRRREIPPSELIEFIWGKESSSSDSALKTLMFRSRKLLAPLNYPPQELLIHRRGSYTWTRELTTIVDADLFEARAMEGLDAALSPEQQLEACMKALNLYKGDFLPKSDYETWVIPLSAHYHSLYQKTVHHAVSLLSEQGNDARIIDLCRKAIAIRPFDEDLHYYLIEALYKSGSQSAALSQYKHTVDMLYSEFSVTPSEHLKSLYKQIRDTEHGITTDLGVIQNSLLPKHQNDGAFFCEYSVFKDIYRLESRAIERTGDSIYLCLLTLSDLSGNLLSQPFLNKGMEFLKEAIRSSLRSGDAFSRYSVSQYIILLPSATYENGEKVMQRIAQSFRKLYARKDMTVGYSLQNVVPPPQPPA